MTLINTIILILVILPIHGFITDIKSGKIKNYFIFPALFFIFILSFFIEGFFQSKENIIGLLIIFLFSFFFYKENRWGAGDGKYLILIGYITIIISFLKGLPSDNAIISLFMTSFLIFFIFNIFYLIFNYKKLNGINWKYKGVITPLNDFFIISLIIIVSQGISYLIGFKYLFLSVFITLVILLPYFKLITNKYVHYISIFITLGIVIYTSNYLGLIIISIFYICFKYLILIIDDIFDIIDTKEIRAIDLKQGNIINKKSFEDIVKYKVEEYPLQGNEVHEILIHIKKNKLNDKIIKIYKDIKIGIFIYISFLIVNFNIVYSIIKEYI